MDNQKEFKPFIPANKIVPEVTATSIIFFFPFVIITSANNINKHIGMYISKKLFKVSGDTKCVKIISTLDIYPSQEEGLAFSVDLKQWKYSYKQNIDNTHIAMSIT